MKKNKRIGQGDKDKKYKERTESMVDIPIEEIWESFMDGLRRAFSSILRAITFVFGLMVVLGSFNLLRPIFDFLRPVLGDFFATVPTIDIWGFIVGIILMLGAMYLSD